MIRNANAQSREELCPGGRQRSGHKDIDRERAIALRNVLLDELKNGTGTMSPVEASRHLGVHVQTIWCVVDKFPAYFRTDVPLNIKHRHNRVGSIISLHPHLRIAS